MPRASGLFVKRRQPDRQTRCSSCATGSLVLSGPGGAVCTGSVQSVRRHALARCSGGRGVRAQGPWQVYVDQRFRNNPLVAGALRTRSYAGRRCASLTGMKRGPVRDCAGAVELHLSPHMRRAWTLVSGLRSSGRKEDRATQPSHFAEGITTTFGNARFKWLWPVLDSSSADASMQRIKELAYMKGFPQNRQFSACYFFNRSPVSKATY